MYALNSSINSRSMFEKFRWEGIKLRSCSNAVSILEEISIIAPILFDICIGKLRKRSK